MIMIFSFLASLFALFPAYREKGLRLSQSHSPYGGWRPPGQVIFKQIFSINSVSQIVRSMVLFQFYFKHGISLPFLYSKDIATDTLTKSIFCQGICSRLHSSGTLVNSYERFMFHLHIRFSSLYGLLS